MSILDKLEKLIGDDDGNEQPRRCFASRARSTVIDEVNPATGKTYIHGNTLAECRAKYPDAEEMTLDEFCAWKAEQQRTPISWEPTTQERYYEMLEVLPPAAMLGGGFLVGEPWDHDAGNGQPRFQAFRQRGDVFEASDRPMTRAEFRKSVIA